jgi:threonylcarbamoyladenosine tRNA methylthiotransferase MtaB
MPALAWMWLLVFLVKRWTFLKNYRYLNEISYLHVFKYSERDNTEAAEMLGVVLKMSVWKVKWCVYRLKNAALLWKPVGKHENSSFLKENKEGYIHGFTENYVKVKPVESG